MILVQGVLASERIHGISSCECGSMFSSSLEFVHGQLHCDKINIQSFVKIPFSFALSHVKTEKEHLVVFFQVCDLFGLDLMALLFPKSHCPVQFAQTLWSILVSSLCVLLLFDPQLPPTVPSLLNPTQTLIPTFSKHSKIPVMCLWNFAKNCTETNVHFLFGLSV